MAGIIDAIKNAVGQMSKELASNKVPEKYGGKDYELAPNPYEDQPWWFQASYTNDPVMDTVREKAEERREESDLIQQQQQGTASAVSPVEYEEESTGLFGGNKWVGGGPTLIGDAHGNKNAVDLKEEPDIVSGSRSLVGGGPAFVGKVVGSQEDNPIEGAALPGTENANQDALRARMEGDGSSEEDEEEGEPGEVDPSDFYKDGVFDYDAYQNELIKNMFDMDMFTFAYSATPEQYYELASDDMLTDLYARELGVDELTLDAMTDWVNAERAMRSVDDVVNAVEGGDFAYLTDSYGAAANSNIYNAILDYAASRGIGVYIPEGLEFNADSLYALDDRSEEDQKSALRNALGMEFLAWALLNDDQGMYATMTPEDVNAYTAAENLEYGQAGQDGYAEATGELPADWAFNPDYAMESYGQGWGYSGNRNMRDLIYNRLGYGWRTRQ